MSENEADWRKYERHIYEKLKEWGGDQAEVEFDKKLRGKISGVERQLDAYVTGAFAGKVQEGLTAAVDCKLYSQNVDINDVESFIGLIEDVQTDLGLLITSMGYSPAAETRGRRRGIHLRVVPPVYVTSIDALPPYVPSHDEPYHEGEFYEYGPTGHDWSGAMISYWVPEGAEEGAHPDELYWESELLASESVAELDWADEAGRKRCAAIVLAHYLKEDPPPADLLDLFYDEIASEWEDGQPWALFAGDIARHLGL